MKWEFRYPLYIRGICHTYTAAVHIHGIYMVYTDYIPRPSGFLPTYNVVGIPTMSYLPDVAYDVVGQDLRCRMCTTSYVMTYDVDIRHRMCSTYDVVTYDVHTISSKPTMSHVQKQCRMIYLINMVLIIVILFY
jgi:hypothetical protein